MSDSEILSDTESLSDDPIDEPIEKVKKTRKPSIKVKKSKKVVMVLPEDAEIGSDSEEETVQLKARKVVKVAPAVRKKREWTDEQRADFALRMKKARDAKLKVKKEVIIPQEEPEIAELIKEGKKVRKAKLKASIKKEALKILKQEQAENMVSDSDSSESEPEMKAVKQYITRRKARKKTKQVKAPPKPKENIIVNQQEEQSLGYQFL
tara:strand:- start:21 stop:644 length:624 start_codon:yes stop_codon:yes gene_type:complete